MIYVVEPRFNPERNRPITAHTKLAPGITMAKFLGGYGSAGNMNHITDDDERLVLAKNYYIHAQYMKAVLEDQGKFNDYRLVVAEGLYKKGPNETLEMDSIADLKRRGRAVVYELRDNYGNIALEKTFDLALYFKDRVEFDKMILNYDTYAPGGKLHAQIILVTPEIIPAWEVEFKNNIETRFNNYVQTTGELVEILNK